MKKTVKAFTLVEMLIVIVIIGILIASLMPRMQSAQGRARDVARKNDLAQIQTAIITSQQDRGKWPAIELASGGMAISGDIENQLKTAGMTQVPGDPNQSNEVKGLGTDTLSSEGKYLYLVTTRNSVPEAGFALMAKTEVEGGSNWVTCDGTAKDLAHGWILKGADLKNITTCTSFEKASAATDCGINSGACKYWDISELRYLLVY